jgi:ethanolaminephosphotransferase
MAPNMVTLLGFMWIVANVFIIEIFVPDMVGPVRVLFLVCWEVES